MHTVITNLKHLFKSYSAPIKKTPDDKKDLSVMHAIVLIAQEANYVCSTYTVMDYVKEIVNSEANFIDFFGKRIGGKYGELAGDLQMMQNDEQLQNYIDTILNAKVFNEGCLC